MDSTSGRAFRQTVPRSAHAQFEPGSNRPSVVDFLTQSSAGRVPELIPVRYYRMSASPYTFYRGAASIMAYDLANAGITTGLRAQICGDAHLSNFGIFATAERNQIFDVNDFDETLPGPWEWDVKRLAASVHIAARTQHVSEKRASDAVRSCVAGYRTHIQQLSALTALQVWYERIDASAIEDLRNAEVTRIGGDTKLITEVDGALRFVDKPPKIYHPPSGIVGDSSEVVNGYIASLRDDIALLVGRYSLQDIALKVVGVGSVGTRCWIALFANGANDHLILQVKEATASCLEAYLEPSNYPEHGHRVVAGQRVMQSASDIFLGWTQAPDGHHYYIRQLSDFKISIDVTALDADGLARYAAFCGNALALGHARSGNPQAMAQYLGNGSRFDDAIAEFAVKYADQNERDYAAFKDAIKSGALPTKEG